MVLNVEIYNNHIRQVKELSLTSAALEARLLSLGYTGEGRIKDEKVESLLLPPIAIVFYSYLFDSGTIPSEDALVEEYFKQPYFSFVPDERVEIDYEGYRTVVSIEGMVARIIRTYPSLVRDLHFYLLLLGSKQFDAVKYSFKADYHDRIDIKVQYKGKWFNVGLMLDSKRSLSFRLKKVFRHKPVSTIDIPLKSADAKRVGDYNLYSEKHLEWLVKQIQSKV